MRRRVNPAEPVAPANLERVAILEDARDLLTSGYLDDPVARRRFADGLPRELINVARALRLVPGPVAALREIERQLKEVARAKTS